MLSPSFRRAARLVLLGGAWGFLAGALAVALVVWKAEPAETWLDSARRFAGAREQTASTGTPRAVPHDPPPAGEPRVGTAGSPDGPGPTPSLGPPPAAELADRDLLVPVDGIGQQQLVRSFDDPRGSRRHEAIDILAPMGTPVRAVEDGRVARLFTSKAGGITVYQFDPTDRYCYYYAHLDRYAPGLRENDVVRKGQIIGYVGVSGNAPKDTPHLHFAIFLLTDQKRWWEGAPIDPFDALQ